ncbi:MAG: hypothetical protein AB7F86_13100 [Bdellovibrionales bacterium]
MPTTTLQDRFFLWMVVILGGLPIALPFVFWVGETGTSPTMDIAVWYYWINAAISGPHVYSTYLRLSRKIDEKKVPSFFGMPAYASAVVGLFIFYKFEMLTLALTLVNIWQSYHYLRQTYGVYRFLGRHSVEDETTKRIGFWAFHAAMPLLVLGRSDTIYHVWQGKAAPYLIPIQMPDMVMRYSYLAFWIAVALGLWLCWKLISRQGWRKAMGPAAVVLTYFAIHYYGFMSVEHFQRGFFAVTIFHAVQYMGMTWWFEKRQPFTDRGFLPFRLLRRSPFLLFWAFLLVGGLLWESGVAKLASFTVFFLSAISLHHYLVDSIIWRRQAGA